MLLEPTFTSHSCTSQDLARYEERCFSHYSGCAQDELPTEFGSLLDIVVGRRRELHRALTERNAEEARAALTELLYLEAQSAALRRLVGDVVAAPPSGPQDRRPQRRRTERD